MPSKKENAIPAYAIAHLRSVAMGPPIVEYLERIDATLAPFEGRFLIHGARAEILEGTWPGHLVVIRFPDLARARAWYASPAYQAILRLRTDNADCSAFIIDGVPEGYRAADALKKAA